MRTKLMILAAAATILQGADAPKVTELDLQRANAKSGQLELQNLQLQAQNQYAIASAPIVAQLNAIYAAVCSAAKIELSKCDVSKFVETGKVTAVADPPKAEAKGK